MGETIVEAYKRAHRRLLLLDYDGTLIPFAPTPEKARPTPGLLTLLQRLGRQTGNTIVIVSGRDRQTLEHTFSHLPVSLAAEHGCFLKPNSAEWQTVCDTDAGWKQSIRQIMNAHALTLPGAFIEEKQFSLVWHYRQAAASLARKAARKLMTHLNGPVKAAGLRLMPGHKIVEVSSSQTNKGHAVERWLAAAPWDFVLAAGDDTTDEDMFAALPPPAVTIKVGRGHSIAQHRLSSPAALRALLETGLLP